MIIVYGVMKVIISITIYNNVSRPIIYIVCAS